MAPASDEPRPWDELLDQLEHDVLGPMSRLAHPGYFASRSSTRLHGRYAIRLCVMNHTSGPADVDAALSWFASAAEPRRPSSVSVDAYEDATADLKGGWGDTGVFDVEMVRRLPLFSGLDAEALEVVVKSAREQLAELGDAVVTRWQGTRHFYVIVSGEAEVRDDRDVLAQLGPGEYFGELAALDWGAGFGYARTANVVATSPLHLLVLPASALDELLRHAPDLDRRLRAAAREHLARM